MRVFTVSGNAVNGGETITIRHQADGNVETIGFRGIPTLASGQIVKIGASRLIHQGDMWVVTLPMFTEAFVARIHVEYGSRTWDSDRVTFAIDPDDVIAVNEAFTAANFKAVTDELSVARGESESLGDRLDAADEAYEAIEAHDENAALWRVVTGNPVTVYAVPESRVFTHISLIASQTGENDPTPANVRPIVPSVAVGDKVQVEITDGDTYDIMTAAADVYGITGALDVIDCEAGTFTRGSKLLRLPATGWDDTDFATDGYFSVALSPAAAAEPAVWCTTFTPATTAAADSDKIVIAGELVKVYPADAVATDLTEWHAWLAENDVDVLYELAEAVETEIEAPAVITLPRLARAVAAATTVTATANEDASPVSAMVLTYERSIIKETADLANPGIVTVAASRALAITDAGKLLKVTADPLQVTLTVPTDASVALPVGTKIEILSYSEHDVIVTTEDGTVGVYSANSYKNIGPDCAATLRKLGANEWSLYGTLKAAE